MKKIISLALALMMVLSLAISASASTITVNGVEGKTYDAYKIFDVIWEDKNSDGQQDKEDGYGYSIAGNSQWYTLVNSYSGLTLTESVTVGTVTYYTVAKNDNFNAANAVIAGNGNTNTIVLGYTNSDSQTGSTTPDTTTTYTYEFDLVKTGDEGNLLSGAEFKLYDAATGGNEIKVVLEEDGSYRLTIGEEGVSIVIPDSGTVKIRGLDGKTTYYLEETKAPAGYNMLAARQPVSITNANLNLSDDAIAEGKYDSENGGGVQVVNKTDSVLPETGAMGTLMFITFGVVVMMATGVLLVTKKRMTMIQEQFTSSQLHNLLSPISAGADRSRRKTY